MKKETALKSPAPVKPEPTAWQPHRGGSSFNSVLREWMPQGSDGVFQFAANDEKGE